MAPDLVESWFRREPEQPVPVSLLPDRSWQRSLQRYYMSWFNPCRQFPPATRSHREIRTLENLRFAGAFFMGQKWFSTSSIFHSNTPVRCHYTFVLCFSQLSFYVFRHFHFMFFVLDCGSFVSFGHKSFGHKSFQPFWRLYAQEGQRLEQKSARLFLCRWWRSLYSQQDKRRSKEITSLSA